MSEPTFSTRLRLAAGAAARKLLGGLLSAACTPTWMPGTHPGATTGTPRRGEHRAQND
jgi:hypothetical protein